jgi:HEAT repeat protein
MVESQYQMVPFNREGNVITTYINQTLVLTQAGPIRSKNVRQPKNPKQSDSDLEYTMDWDKELEEFLMKGEGQARLPVDIKERRQIIAQILRPLVAEMRDCVSEQAPVHYAQLIKMLRLTEKSQLEQIFQDFVHAQPESFSQEEHQKIKALLTDALADAGTKDTISYLFHLIKEQKLSPLRASITVKHLINIRTPSKEIVQEFLALLESEPVRQSWILKQSVQLTLGSVVAGLCMPSEDRLAVLPRPSFDKLPRRLAPNAQLCPQQLQDQLIEQFFGIVERASEEEVEDAVLALKTIGNMGIPKAVLKLEQLIQQKEKKTMIRIEAILALRQLRETLPQKVTEILMPVFMNKQEANEVRVAAVYQLLQTLPARPVLDQLARSLFSERSRQVSAFVYTYMNTLANSTNPCEEKFARNLKLALRHGRKISGAFLPQYSKYLHGATYSRKFHLGADVNFASLINNETFVPQFSAVNLHLTALGFWSKNILGLSVAQENVESLVARYLRRTELSDISLDDILSRSPRSAASSLKELKNVWEQLKTVARKMDNQGTPKAYANLQMKDQSFFMLPMTQKSLSKLPSVQEIRRMLEEGSHFNVHKAAMLHEMEYKIPTSIGFPIIVNIRVPTVSQISGQVRIETRNPFKLHLNNMKPSMAASVFTVVSVWTPIVSSGVKIIATAKVCTPVSAKVELDINARQPQLRLSVEPEAKSVEYIKIETRPMTWTRKYSFPLTAYPEAEYKTIVGEEWNRVMNVRDQSVVRKTEEIIQKVTGQRVRVEGTWHRTPVSAPKYLPVCPFSGPNHISIRSEASNEQPKEFVLQIAAEIKKGQAQDKIRSERFQMDSQEEESQEEQQAYETIIKSELFTKGAQKERKAEMETRISFSPSLRILQAESELQVSPIPELSQRKFKLCSRASVQYPRSAQSFSQLEGKRVVAQMKTTWGADNCQEENKVEIKMNAQHSQKQQEMWESEPEFSYWRREQDQEQNLEQYSPIQKQEALRKAQQLFQYNLEAKYSNIHPALKNATAKVFKAIKNYYYWNTQEINFDLENPANTIRAQMTIDPRNRQFFNLTVKTPVENVTMTDAKLPIQLLYPVSIRKVQSEIESQADFVENVMSPMLANCRLSSQRLQTFDQVSIRAPLSDCWTLLSKDCDNEAQPSYAVLVKKTSAESEQKAVKIITPQQTVQITPSGSRYGALKIKVNGKEISEEELPHREQQIQIEKSEEEQMVKVALKEAGVRVQFDGYSVKVQMSPALQARQCGICGHYDNEVEDELRTPQNEIASDARRFIQAHTLKGEQCQFPENLQDIDSSSEELSWEPRWEQDGSRQDSQADSDEQDKSASASSEEWDREESVRPVQRHVVEEEGSKICVSSQKVPRCPRNAFPQQYEAEKRQVVFRCISRSHPQAHRILKIAREESQLPQWVEDEMKQQEEEAYTSDYSIPKRCSRQL